jgi:5-aminolevulinate synthase
VFDYDSFFVNRIEQIKEDGRYRTFVEIERLAGRFPKALHYHASGVREVTVWCSNDHLGMGQHPEVVAAMKASIDRSGVAAGGSRNISGTNHTHVLLEKEIAELHGKERGLVLITGYAANEAALGVLGKHLPNCVFFSDEFNHASMILGMKLSGAERHIFRHNDVDHLKRMLASVDPERPKVVAFESIYSMDGDMAPLAELCAVAKRYGALVYVDEAHTVAMYGPGGAGLAAQLGVSDQVDVLMGTFAKGYGTAGGYLVGADAVLDTIRSFAPAFIFTLSIPSPLAAAALTSVRYLRKSEWERAQLHERAAQLKGLLRNMGIPMISEDSHIVPVQVGDPHRCKQLADRLLAEHAIYVQPINFPSVARGTERLRINPSPVHKPVEVEQFARAINAVWSELGLARVNDIDSGTIVDNRLLAVQ